MKRSLTYSCFYSFLTACFLTAPATARSVSVVKIKNPQGQETALYERSYALVIGVSDYTEWPDLPGVKEDMKTVRAILEEHGFNVKTVENPTRHELPLAFEDFIGLHGGNVHNRLLFYFAGHGHTVHRSYGEEMGYIVPTDAPDPRQNKTDFLVSALDMQQIEVYAKRIDAKHALFVFDSCFSGSVFLTRSQPIPKSISYKVSEPVRQFITSGSADERVPDVSTFRQQFVAALQGEGDSNKDNYVTGAELGEFLRTTVVDYTRGTQHPQVGTIRHPRLDKGDVVFQLALAPPASPPPPNPPASRQPMGHLQVIVTVPNAKVFINDRFEGTASSSQPLNKPNVRSGLVDVRVEAEGYQSQRLQAKVDAGQRKQLAVCPCARYRSARTAGGYRHRAHHSAHQAGARSPRG